MKPEALSRWHHLLETKNFAAIDELLADNAVFQSPVVHSPQVGKPVVALYLKSAAMLLMSGGNFHYTHEWWNDQSAVLEFEVEVNGILVNGVDMIFWNAEGKIERFKVMIWPLKAINLVYEAMGWLLAGAKF